MGGCPDLLGKQTRRLKPVESSSLYASANPHEGSSMIARDDIDAFEDQAQSKQQFLLDDRFKTRWWYQVLPPNFQRLVPHRLAFTAETLNEINIRY